MTCEVSCPEPDNLADVSLQLQETALEAERCIFNLEKLLRAAVNRPTFIQTNTASIAVNSNIDTPINSGGAPTTTFDNLPFSDLIPVSSWSNLPRLGGAVWLGAQFNATASGVVNDNTHRTTKLSVTHQSITEQVWVTQFEPNVGGGIDVTISGIFACDPGFSTATVLFNHLNTSSTVLIAAGAVFWATWLGDTQIAKVV